jgi:rhamnosyltransferase
MENKEPKIGAILVLYKPDMKVTVPAIMSLAPQVDEICLVDNTPGQDIAHEFKDIPNASYIPLGENKGIAAAQNIGIKHFINLDFDFVLFSDQDSQSPNGIVRRLINEYEYLLNLGVNIATIGPLPYNYTNNQKYITKKNIIKNIKDEFDDFQFNILEMYSIISSFSLIALDTFNEVGMFKESLFIDGVDDEWGWRARYIAGRRSFISLDNKISHVQGSDATKYYKKSTPFRTYYQFRNFIWLQRLQYVPTYWKKRNWIKIIIKTFFYPLCVKPRYAFFKSIIKGYRDGFKYKL